MRVNQLILKCIFKRQTFFCFFNHSTVFIANSILYLVAHTLNVIFYVFNSVLPTNVYPLISSFHGDVAGWPLCHVAPSTAMGRKSPTLLRPKKICLPPDQTLIAYIWIRRHFTRYNVNYLSLFVVLFAFPPQLLKFMTCTLQTRARGLRNSIFLKQWRLFLFCLLA